MRTATYRGRERSYSFGHDFGEESEVIELLPRPTSPADQCVMDAQWEITQRILNGTPRVLGADIHLG